MSARIFSIEVCRIQDCRSEDALDSCCAYRIKLRLANDQRRSFAVTGLVMSFRHQLDPLSFTGGFRFKKRIGDIISLDCAQHLNKQEVLCFEFIAYMPQSLRYSDYPAGLYALNDTGEPLVFNPSPQADQSQRKSLEGAPIRQIALIPRPQSLHDLGQSIPFPSAFNITALPAAMQNWLHRLNARFKSPLNFSQQGFPVYIHYSKASHELKNAYELHVDSQQILLSCQPLGEMVACASLAQILLQSAEIGRLSMLKIKDHACFAYRGFMLDIARHFLPAQDLLDWLDLCALLKLNKLHLHLSDDEGWRLEIEGQPHLTQIGAWRGHDLPIPPHFNANPAPHGGYLSKEDCANLVARAKELQINLIPEINFPSHARALLKSCSTNKKALSFHNFASRSDYCSVQYYNDNVLSLTQSHSPFAVIEALIELLLYTCEAFSCDYVHCGGDEIPAGAWDQDPNMEQLKAQLGCDGQAPHKANQAIMAWFYRELIQRLAAHGIAIGLWDDAAAPLALCMTAQEQAQMTLYSWNDYSANSGLRDLLEKLNSPLVLCPASHCYFDHPVTKAPSDPGLTWAQPELNLSQVFEWEIIPKNIPINRIHGLQANLWSELCASKDDFSFMALPRLFAFAERCWIGEPDICESAADFHKKALRYGRWLAQTGVKIRDISLKW